MDTDFILRLPRNISQSKQVPGHPSHETTDNFIAGSWSPRLTKPRTTSPQVPGHPTHKTTDNFIAGSGHPTHKTRSNFDAGSRLPYAQNLGFHRTLDHLRNFVIFYSIRFHTRLFVKLRHLIHFYRMFNTRNILGGELFSDSAFYPLKSLSMPPLPPCLTIQFYSSNQLLFPVIIPISSSSIIYLRHSQSIFRSYSYSMSLVILSLL